MPEINKNMIDTKTAESLISESLCALEEIAEEIPFSEAINRRICEDVHADRDFPPFNRVMLDGIALKKKDISAGKLKIKAKFSAGEKPEGKVENGTCFETATGAMLPEGADFVLQNELYEKRTDESGEFFAFFEPDGIPKTSGIHLRGSDAKKGDMLISKGTFLQAGHIAILATVGKKTVRVRRLPEIIILATGDELYTGDGAPEAHQIRPSNPYVITAAIKKFFPAAPVRILILNDEKNDFENVLSGAKDKQLFFISSGAVSAGEKDFIPATLRECGFEIVFHKVKQRPGKPFLFAAKEQIRFFGLPGNPASALIGTYRYILPALFKFSGHRDLGLKIPLAENFHFQPNLTLFLPCTIREGEACPLSAQNSGDLIGTVPADGFLELPADKNDFQAGEFFRFFPF
jgi:molybdopterin molybdotransferase